MIERLKQNNQIKLNKTMAEVMDMHTEYATKGKANAALTTGIIGTALGGILAMKDGLFNGILGGCGTAPAPVCNGIPHGELYNERKEQEDFVELTKQYYEAQIATNAKIDKNFFDLYKMNVDTSFGLYKNHVDDSFKLYKGQRDQADAIFAKIADVEKKVDVMAAIRPYQDALINCKIDNVAQVSDFNLARRTCRMITGELVLPSTPTVTGYPSYSPCNPVATTTGA
jgi:hypothetical protein